MLGRLRAAIAIVDGTGVLHPEPAVQLLILVRPADIHPLKILTGRMNSWFGVKCMCHCGRARLNTFYLANLVSERLFAVNGLFAMDTVGFAGGRMNARNQAYKNGEGPRHPP